ncbi:hypothetical protein K503DRAFT_332831 [Rhizopogon vinicolor AM-OR11-026]|uniref:Glycosyl transferase CAP10 domain-containing protein n=1 Tax=Rhizopogon vinicolor AM-OR11-026 TaxID=1314800 RepID=A0A1B7NCL3_9AGAM|nr:hypothetical protein K503DRAFT_332831 [Rhizopogon vinicolor AM-OR11-026]
MRLNHGMLDIVFAGSPNQCKPETRKELEEKNESEGGGQVQVDGNGWSSQFKRLMTANTLTFKSTIYPECRYRFTDRLAPWVHYVPIQNAYTTPSCSSAVSLRFEGRMGSWWQRSRGRGWGEF